jgi:secreted trypsin-like serine protease
MRKNSLVTSLVALVLAATSVSSAFAITSAPSIIGGQEIDIDEAPWQVGLLRPAFPGDTQWDRQFCGGSIINETWIITAAHCVVDIADQPSQVSVFAGSADLEQPTGTYEYPARRILIHELYAGDFHDIALIELDTPISLVPGQSEAIDLPYSLDSAVWPAQKTNVFVSGWGEQTGYEVGDYPSILRGANLTVLAGPTDIKCGAYKSSEWNPYYEICVGSPSTPRDTCQGDSGGPYVIQANANGFGGAEPTLAGITSWGEGCANPKYPGFATRVTSYIDWIVPELSFVKSTPAGDSTFLEWGFPMTGQVTALVSDTFFFQKSDDGGDSWQDAGVKVGDEHFATLPYSDGRIYRVAAISDLNEDDPINQIWVTSENQSTHKAETPPSPINVKVKKSGSTLRISWSLPTLKKGLSTGGSVIWAYQIYLKQNNSNDWVAVVTTDANRLTANVPDLVNGKTQYAVAAVSNQGVSVYSKPVSVNQ